MSDRTAAPRTVLAAAIALPLALGAVAWSLRADAFDTATWRAEAGKWGEANRRQDLYVEAERRLPPGTPRDAVVRLLGPPDATGPEADRYALGRATWSVSLETLVIPYDAKGRVAAIRVDRS